MTRFDFEILWALRLFDARWTLSELRAYLPQRRKRLILKLQVLVNNGLVIRHNSRYSISLDGEQLLDATMRQPIVGLSARQWIANVRAGFDPLKPGRETRITRAAIPGSLNIIEHTTPPIEELIDALRSQDAK